MVVAWLKTNVSIMTPFQFDQIFQCRGYPLAMWQGEYDKQNRKCGDGGSTHKKIFRTKEYHAGNDQAGQTRGGNIHKRPGVGLVGDKIQLAVTARIMHRVPAFKKITHAALWASLAQSAPQQGGINFWV